MKRLNKIRLMKYFLCALLIVFYVITVFILNSKFGSLIAIFWWTILYGLMSFYIMRVFNDKAKTKKIDYLSILTLIIAGLLTLQLSQPIFSPSISEFNKLESRTEYWIVWPREIGAEKFDFKVLQHSSYEISVLPPLFPFENIISIDSLFGKNISLERNDWYEIRGPIQFVSAEKKNEIRTLSDGFKVRSAKAFTKTVMEIPFQEDIEIRVNKYEPLSWESLSDKQMIYFSDFLFSNQIVLSKFFSNRKYKNQIIKKFNINIFENGITFDDNEDPDFFELEKCQIEIINKTQEKKIIRLTHNGFYPRSFFSYQNTNLPNEEILDLQNGIIVIEGMESKVLNVIELKSRRNFHEIFEL